MLGNEQKTSKPFQKQDRANVNCIYIRPLVSMLTSLSYLLLQLWIKPEFVALESKKEAVCSHETLPSI